MFLVIVVWFVVVASFFASSNFSFPRFLILLLTPAATACLFLSLSFFRWEDRTNYGAEDYGGVSTASGGGDSASSSSSFADKLLRKVSSRPRANDDFRGSGSDGAKKNARASGARQTTASATAAAAEAAAEAAAAEAAEEEAEAEGARLRELMYWGLTRSWEEGLARELAHTAAGANQKRTARKGGQSEL